MPHRLASCGKVDRFGNKERFIENERCTFFTDIDGDCWTLSEATYLAGSISSKDQTYSAGRTESSFGTVHCRFDEG